MALGGGNTHPSGSNLPLEEFIKRHLDGERTYQGILSERTFKECDFGGGLRTFQMWPQGRCSLDDFKAAAVDRYHAAT